MTRNTPRISIARPAPYTEESNERLNSLKLIRTFQRWYSYKRQRARTWRSGRHPGHKPEHTKKQNERTGDFLWKETWLIMTYPSRIY